MEQRYFYSPFAAEGDQTQVTMTVETSGIVSYPQGWTPPYNLNLLTDPAALAMDRLRFNSVMYDITFALQDLQQYGTPEFIDATDNLGTAYSYGIGAMVRYSSSGEAPFILYASTVSENTDTPSLTDGNWQPVKLAQSGSFAATAGGNGSFTVPNGIYTIFAQGWGGGGGGGSTAGNPSAGSGGQAGGYVEGWQSVTPGQVINYHVGLGGAAGGATGTQAGNGGDTTINFGGGNVWTAGGGGGGYGANGGFANTIGAKPTASGGEFTSQGSIGPGFGEEVGAGVAGYGGQGGSPYGGGGAVPGAFLNAGLGSYPGGGGGGGGNSGSGGNGNLGLIKFSW
jgi:hypothetical protein